MDGFLDIIITIGFGISFVNAISKITKRHKNPKDYLISTLYFSIGITQLAIWNVSVDLTLRYPHLTEIDVPLIFLYGPLIYLIYKSISSSNFKITKIHLLNFIPFFLSCMIMVPYYIKDSSYKRELALKLFSGISFSSLEIAWTIGFLISLFYIIYIKGDYTGTFIQIVKN